METEIIARENMDANICNRCGESGYVHFRESMEYLCDKCIEKRK